MLVAEASVSDDAFEQRAACVGVDRSTAVHRHSGRGEALEHEDVLAREQGKRQAVLQLFELAWVFLATSTAATFGGGRAQEVQIGRGGLRLEGLTNW